MENTESTLGNTSNRQQDGLFGVSSDQIIDLLHQGELKDDGQTSAVAGGDKDQIVNEQDQLDIVNPAADDVEEGPETIPVPDATAQNKPMDVIERESIPGDKEISQREVKNSRPDILGGE